MNNKWVLEVRGQKRLLTSKPIYVLRLNSLKACNTKRDEFKSTYKDLYIYQIYEDDGIFS